MIADGNSALEVQYALTPESWYPIREGLAQPVLVYTLDGTVVSQQPIQGQVGKHVLTRDRAYNDSQLTVEVRDARGVYDSLQVGGWTGGAYTVRVLGPTRPVPAPPPRTTTTSSTTSSPAGSSASLPAGSSSRSTSSTTRANVDIDVQPEDVVAIATDTIALIQQQQQRQQQKAAAGSVGTGDPSAPVLDPNDPTVLACAAIDRNRVTQCYATYGARPQGAAELEACGRFTVPGLQRECREHVARAALPLLEVIEACQQGFGTETPGVRCMNVAVEAATPPAQDIRACTEHLEAEPERLGCIARFAQVEWSPASVLPVCKAAYPDDVIACLAHIAGPFPEKPGLAKACADGLEGELGLDCMAMMRRRDGDPVALVEACTAGFATSKERFKCVEIARSPRVDAARIATCASDDRPLKCMER
ncbi:MAG: hypothetical protein R3F61_07030 [Myxococcota bacterium]